MNNQKFLDQFVSIGLAMELGEYESRSSIDNLVTDGEIKKYPMNKGTKYESYVYSIAEVLKHKKGWKKKT